MSDYPGATKAEVEADIAPVIREYLEKHGQRFTAGRDTAGHKVYTHGASRLPEGESNRNIHEWYAATAVYEGDVWAEEFVEEMNGVIDTPDGDRSYDIEVWSSYEICIRILDDYRS